MMTAPSASFTIDGVLSLEVRWIFAGRLAGAMASWFGRFPAQTVTLTDAYLMDPHLPGLSVKVRERRALEVKVYHGSPGLLEVPGCARGRLESWQKWSFPCDLASRGSDHLAGWQTVRKSRRIIRFSRGDGSVVAPFPEPGEQPGCAAELAEFRALGEDWWTLGFEATGPVDLLHGKLRAAAALVFGQAPPGGEKLDTECSVSYARWLRGQPGTGHAFEA